MMSCTLHRDKIQPSLIFPLFCFSLQGRHVKTGQLAAIKVMDVTEVSKHSAMMYLFIVLLS